MFYALLSVLLALPISILGIGNRDMLVTGLFPALGSKPDAGIVSSCFHFGDSLPIALIGGLVQLREVVRRRSSH